MTYSVKEIFYTLQGEGAQAGRPAVFCRFTGCNLWSGLERDRQTATCNFCDTDFVGTDGEGGGKFATPDALVIILPIMFFDTASGLIIDSVRSIAILLMRFVGDLAAAYTPNLSA